MARFGYSLIDTSELGDTKDLPTLLSATRDLARLTSLVIFGLKLEEKHGVSPGDYDDFALLHSLLWPLELASERAVELEREQHPAAPVVPEGGA